MHELLSSVVKHAKPGQKGLVWSLKGSLTQHSVCYLRIKMLGRHQYGWPSMMTLLVGLINEISSGHYSRGAT